MEMMVGGGVAEGVLTRCRLASPQSSCVSWPIYNMLSSVGGGEKQDSTSVVFPRQILPFFLSVPTCSPPKKTFK